MSQGGIPVSPVWLQGASVVSLYLQNYIVSVWHPCIFSVTTVSQGGIPFSLVWLQCLVSPVWPQCHSLVILSLGCQCGVPVSSELHCISVVSLYLQCDYSVPGWYPFLSSVTTVPCLSGVTTVSQFGHPVSSVNTVYLCLSSVNTVSQGGIPVSPVWLQRPREVGLSHQCDTSGNPVSTVWLQCPGVVSLSL